MILGATSLACRSPCSCDCFSSSKDAFEKEAAVVASTVAARGMGARMGDLMRDLQILTVIAVPIAAIAGLVMAIGTRGRLRLLESRFAGLEQRLGDWQAVLRWSRV